MSDKKTAALGNEEARMKQALADDAAIDRIRAQRSESRADNSDQAQKVSTSDAVDQLCRALKADDGYWMSWQANIAVQFQDAWQQAVDNGGLPATREQIHDISNKAAVRFLNLLTYPKADALPEGTHDGD
jgi:hypothetical protein